MSSTLTNEEVGSRIKSSVFCSIIISLPKSFSFTTTISSLANSEEVNAASNSFKVLLITR